MLNNLNKEGRITYRLLIIFSLVLLFFINYNYNEIKGDEIIIFFYFFHIIIIFINLYYKDQRLLRDFHSFISFIIILGPLIIRNKALAKIYIMLCCVTLWAWLTNNDRCYLSHMDYDNKIVPENHFTRSKLMKKYYIDYFLMIFFISFTIYKFKFI